jgi:hypothetical protein
MWSALAADKPATRVREKTIHAYTLPKASVTVLRGKLKVNAAR